MIQEAITHKIRSQALDVEFENPPNAFELNDRLSDVSKSKLLPALEQLFDEKAQLNRTLKIERLFVDVGTLNQDNWEEELSRKVVVQVGEYLDDLISGNTFKVEHQDIESEISGQIQPVTIGEGEVIHETENIQSSLLYFLEHGLLPWYSSIQSKKELEQVFSSQIDSEGDFLTKVRNLVFTSESAFERLVYQLSEEKVLSILSFENLVSTEILKIRKSWEEIFNKIKVQEQDQILIFLKSIRTVYLNKEQKLSKQELLEKFSINILESLEDENRILLTKVLAQAQSQNHKSQVKEILQVIKKNNQEKSKASAGKSMEKGKGDDNDKQDIKQKNENEQNDMDADTPVYIMNAGLVLLNPFLSAIFEKTGFTRKNNWRSRSAHQRAVLLTQFLVTGEEKYPEFELILNKILAGFPLKKSLPASIKLKKSEKAEASKLLKSVIEHWKALKGTSIEGLQTTFLQREGKLVRRESGWLLRVDQKAFDVLIDKLPWGFSTIKTPWMTDILSVEWI